MDRAGHRVACTRLKTTDPFHCFQKMKVAIMLLVVTLIAASNAGKSRKGKPSIFKMTWPNYAQQVLLPDLEFLMNVLNEEMNE